MLTEKELMNKTGELGERIVAKYFTDLGHKVEQSLNLLDHKKDMTIDGKTCEVKTQQPWQIENAFTVRSNQIRKCREVDHLIFIETPSKSNGYKVDIYSFPKEDRTVRTKITRDNRQMFLYDKGKGTLLTSIDDPDIVDQFKRYSLSEWK